MESELRKRLGEALGREGWWLLDYPTASRDSGDCSGGGYDALGLEDLPDGCVVVRVMLGFNTLDDSEAELFGRLAAERGVDTSDEEAYDRAYDDWCMGTGLFSGEPHEGQDEALEAEEIRVLDEVARFLRGAGFSLATPDYVDMKVEVQP